MKTHYYIGLDVHKENTTYAVRDRLGNVVAEGETATLYNELQPQLKTYLKSAQIVLEASTSYYTLYQNFLKDKHDIKVANTIQLRQLITKNDRLDAKRLAEMLRLGTCPASHIPGKEIQQLRSMVSLRHSIMEEKTRCNSRIQALLDKNGITMPPHKAFTKAWKNALNQHIGSGNATFELRHAYDHFTFLENKQEQLDQEMIGYTRLHWQKDYDTLQSITGIGPRTACYVIAQVSPISRFINKRKLRRYAGVVPVFQESAGKKKGGKIPKTSSRGLLRWALIQSANAIAKTDTRLGKYYRKKAKQKKNTSIAKVAVSSSLCDIIYEVMTTQKPYQA
jgi:transposase